MARIKGKDLFLKDDDQIYFGDNQEGTLWYAGADLRLTHTISGVYPTAYGHLTTKQYVDENDIFTFLELNDTPVDYTGSQYLYVRVKQDETGLEFAVASGIEGSKGETGFGLWATATVDGDGTVRDSHNLNVSRSSTGTYNCTFVIAAPDTYYGVVAQPYQTVTDTNAMVSNISTAGFTLKIGQGDNGTSPDVLADTDFSVLVYGSQGLPDVPASGITFLQLLDTPSDYTGFENYVVAVKPNGSGLEFVATVSGITDHGDLSGLTDDDHTYYVPTDGSRGFTATVSGKDPIQDYHLTTKQYVDDNIVDEFIELTDTPSDYSGAAGYSVKVKNDETGLEFIPTSSGVDLSFLDLNDTPIAYSGSELKYARVNADGSGLHFENAIVGVTSTGTTPPTDSNLWYNATENIFYYYDSTRGDWLSLNSHNYLYTRQGNIDGLYLSVGDLRHAEAHYFIPRAATVTAIISSSEKVFNSNKSFELRDQNATTLYSFNQTGWEYNNLNSNVLIDANTQLRCFCTSAGSRVRNPGITLEVRWRYVV